MTTQEHLNRIKSKCESLLAIASKRTPKQWLSFPADWLALEGSFVVGNGLYHTVAEVRPGNGDIKESPANAAFIASCAGPAEAGWRATIAAIEGLQPVAAQVPIMGSVDDYRAGQMHMGEALKSHANAAIKSILAAWPEKLL